MTKGILYYTDFHVDRAIHKICLDQLKKSFIGKIVSVSLNYHLDLGLNLVMHGVRSNTMMIKQIIAGLEALETDIVFFCEHDVLYTKEHFDFIPEKNNVFYYDLANWRWDYPKDRVINYDQLTSLSMMCVNRKWALEHYYKRLKKIIDSGWDKQDAIGNLQPVWVRALGYEPGTKRRRIGGFSDDVSERWRSELPCIDIRHSMTLSKPKTRLKDFKHLPTGWQEEPLSFIKNFDLKIMFNLK